jgi:hypothetical protein
VSDEPANGKQANKTRRSFQKVLPTKNSGGITLGLALEGQARFV